MINHPPQTHTHQKLSQAREVGWEVIWRTFTIGAYFLVETVLHGIYTLASPPTRNYPRQEGLRGCLKNIHHGGLFSGNYCMGGNYFTGDRFTFTPVPVRRVIDLAELHQYENIAVKVKGTF